LAQLDPETVHPHSWWFGQYCPRIPILWSLQHNSGLPGRATVSATDDGQTIDITLSIRPTRTPPYSKPPGHINELSKCKQADTQMRDCVRELIAELQIPKYTASACERTGCVLNVLKPAVIPCDPVRVTDTAPAARWNIQHSRPKVSWSA
jgi:hypothetical protein